MPNKSKGSELWSEIVQVSVTPEVKNKINAMANAAGVSNSEIARTLLDRCLEDVEIS